MHMAETEPYVKPDAIVFGGQQIGRGAGVGDQFRSPQAGEAHVHNEVRRDGQLVDPTTGYPLERHKK